MSWDIFVQDLPPGLGSVEEMPDDFRPAPLGDRTSILAAILRAAPDADARDPTWLKIDRPEGSIEINLGDAGPVTSFALHVRGTDAIAANVAAILREVGARALALGTESGIFDPEDPAAGLSTWREYRRRLGR